MKFKYFIVSLIASLFGMTLALDQETQDGGLKIANFTKERSQFIADHNFTYQQAEYPGPKWISFDTIGKNVAIGLDYLVPFVEVPIKRKRNAPPKPLVIVNSAAIVSCGLVAAGGMLIGHLMRNLGLEAPDFKEDKKDDEEAAESRQYRDDSTSERQMNFNNFFEHFKLVYRNESGSRITTTFPSLFRTIEQTFQENDINLPVCIRKSLCTFVLKATENVRLNQATDLERLIDSAFKWPGLITWLQQFGLPIEYDEAFISNKNPRSQAFCQLKYPTCKWSAPEERLWDLINTNIQLA